MGQHGFARDMEFVPDVSTDTELWFTLSSSEETLGKYPYAFVLKISCRIDESSVEVLWSVENPGEEELPFSIGGHPAFNCPMKSGQKQTDCKIKFDVDAPLFGVWSPTGKKAPFISMIWDTVKSLMEHNLEVRKDRIIDDRDLETGKIDLNKNICLPKDMPTAFGCNSVRQSLRVTWRLSHRQLHRKSTHLHTM